MKSSLFNRPVCVTSVHNAANVTFSVCLVLATIALLVNIYIGIIRAGRFDLALNGDVGSGILLALFSFLVALGQFSLTLVKQLREIRRTLRFSSLFCLYLCAYYVAGLFGVGDTISWLAALQDIARITFLFRLLSQPHPLSQWRMIPALLVLCICWILVVTCQENAWGSGLPVVTADILQLSSFFFVLCYYLVAAVCCMLAVGSASPHQPLSISLSLSNPRAPAWLLASVCCVGMAGAAFAPEATAQAMVPVLLGVCYTLVPVCWTVSSLIVEQATLQDDKSALASAVRHTRAFAVKRSKVLTTVSELCISPLMQLSAMLKQMQNVAIFSEDGLLLQQFRYMVNRSLHAVSTLQLGKQYDQLQIGGFTAHLVPHSAADVLQDAIRRAAEVCTDLGVHLSVNIEGRVGPRIMLDENYLALLARILIFQATWRCWDIPGGGRVVATVRRIKQPTATLTDVICPTTVSGFEDADGLLCVRSALLPQAEWECVDMHMSQEIPGWDILPKVHFANLRDMLYAHRTIGPCHSEASTAAGRSSSGMSSSNAPANDLPSTSNTHTSVPLNGSFRIQNASGQLDHIAYSVTPSEGFANSEPHIICASLPDTSTFTPEKSWLQLSIFDNASPLPPQLHHQLFKPWTPATDFGTHLPSSSGMGLTICREVVRALGGQIGYQVLDQSSSRFFVEIPLWELDESAPARPSTSARLRYRASEQEGEGLTGPASVDVSFDMPPPMTELPADVRCEATQQAAYMSDDNSIPSAFMLHTSAYTLPADNPAELRRMVSALSVLRQADLTDVFDCSDDESTEIMHHEILHRRAESVIQIPEVPAEWNYAINEPHQFKVECKW